MERSEMIAINAAGIVEQTNALQRHAKPSVKVLVVANPANTNCLCAINAAKSIPARNFTCLTRLDQERLRGMLSTHFKAPVRDVVIWGNHSSTQVPYVDAAKLFRDGVYDTEVTRISGAEEVLPSIVERVQRRGAEIIKAQGASSAMSAASAIAKHLADWIGPYHADMEMFSMGMISDGNTYGVPAGLVYSFPCRRTEAGVIQIVDDLPISAEIRRMMELSTEELLAEKAELENIVGKVNISPSRL